MTQISNNYIKIWKIFGKHKATLTTSFFFSFLLPNTALEWLCFQQEAYLSKHISEYLPRASEINGTGKHYCFKAKTGFLKQSQSSSTMKPQTLKEVKQPFSFIACGGNMALSLEVQNCETARCTGHICKPGSLQGSTSLKPFCQICPDPMLNKQAANYQVYFFHWTRGHNVLQHPKFKHTRTE